MMTVQELLARISRGQLRVPDFLRDLRWRPEDQVKLLDSVLQGIPIGTLLLSEPFVDQGVPAAPGELVVDGQQRIHALRALMTPPVTGTRALHLDTEDRTFRYARVDALEMDSTLIPVGLLGDRDALLDALMAPPVSRATLATALDVSQRLREYRVPVYTLRDTTEHDARMAFYRINASGRRWRQAEVFNALHAHGGDKPVPSTLQVVSALEPLGFGRLADDEVTKTVAVLLGRDPGRDVRQLDLSDAADTIARAEQALSRAITFLRDDAEIPHREALPYVLPLLVLARLFDKHPEPSPRSRILLRRWVWRGAATGAHQGARASLRDALHAVTDDEDASVQALLAGVPRDAASFEFSPQQTVRKRHAVDRIVFCALAARHPVDLRDGTALDLSTLASRWSVTSAVAPEEGGGIWATALLHPRMRRSELTRLLATAAPEVLRGHVIRVEARDALALGDTARFVALRGADLAERVKRFLIAHAEWSASDHLTLARLSETA